MDDPLILDDETERLEAEVRFERAVAANKQAPAIIARLLDMRYVKVTLLDAVLEHQSM